MTSFLWAASFDDLVFEIVLMFMAVLLVVLLVLFIWLRGKWGALFYRAGNLNIGLEYQMEGSIDGFTMKPFGSMKIISSGDKKGQFIIPRYNSSFKGLGGPVISMIAGRGIGHEVNPFIAEYLRRSRGAWPKWSGAAPPKSLTDIDSMYQMYADWKAEGEKPEENKKDLDQFIKDEIERMDMPEGMPDAQQIQWVKEQREKLKEVYLSSGGGGFTEMAKQLKNPTLTLREKNGLHEFLNSKIISEPADLWPTWISGFVVKLQDLAHFVEPVSAAEFTFAMSLVKDAFAKDANTQIIKILVICFGIALVFVGMGVTYKLVAG